MEYDHIFEAIERHFDETKLIIDQLEDEKLSESPVATGRSLGEVVLHLIRSIEYYTQGLSKDIWKPLDYRLEEYSTSLKIRTLYIKVIAKATRYLLEIDRDSLQERHENGNREAKRVEVLLEMLEHSIQHRGQILVYLRLLSVEPTKIPYII